MQLTTALSVGFGSSLFSNLALAAPLPIYEANSNSPGLPRLIARGPAAPAPILVARRVHALEDDAGDNDYDHEYDSLSDSTPWPAAKYQDTADDERPFKSKLSGTTDAYGRARPDSSKFVADDYGNNARFDRSEGTRFFSPDKKRYNSGESSFLDVDNDNVRPYEDTEASGTGASSPKADAAESDPKMRKLMKDLNKDKDSSMGKIFKYFKNVYGDEETSRMTDLLNYWKKEWDDKDDDQASQAHKDRQIIEFAGGIDAAALVLLLGWKGYDALVQREKKRGNPTPELRTPVEPFDPKSGLGIKEKFTTTNSRSSHYEPFPPPYFVVKADKSMEGYPLRSSSSQSSRRPSSASTSSSSASDSTWYTAPQSAQSSRSMSRSSTFSHPYTAQGHDTGFKNTVAEENTRIGSTGSPPLRSHSSSPSLIDLQPPDLSNPELTKPLIPPSVENPEPLVKIAPDQVNANRAPGKPSSSKIVILENPSSFKVPEARII